MFNVPNPNLLSGTNILTDVGTDPVFPTKKDEPQKPLWGRSPPEPSAPLREFRLPYKSIFDQKKEMKGLFDEPKKVQTQNPNLVTYQEMGYLVDGETQEDMGAEIQLVNNALKSSNYILAEQALGRKLTASEIARQRVSDETVYSLPSSEPSYKTYENLNLMFDVSDPIEESKLRQLTQILSKESIPYTLKSLDDKTIVLASQKRIDKIYFPKAVASQSREEEDQEKTEISEISTQTLPQGWKKSYLETIKLPSTNWKGHIDKMTDTYQDLLQYASNIGLTSLQSRGDFKDNKKYLGYLRKEVKSFIQFKIDNPAQRDEPPPLEKVEKVEKVEYGSGLSTRKKKAPLKIGSSLVNTTLTPRPYKRKY